MTNKLTDKQWQAIAILSVPGRAGMTYEEVAEHVGVSDKTLREWRKREDFNEAIKTQVLNNAIDHLPEVFEALPKIIVEEGNGSVLRTWLQSLGMLTDKKEVEVSSKDGVDVDEIKEKLKSLEQRD